MTENEIYAMLLDKVVTVAEVCDLCGVTQKTVMMAIHKERIAARQTEVGNTWLVLKSSAEKWFNEPKRKAQREKLVEQRSRKLQAINASSVKGDAA